MIEPFQDEATQLRGSTFTVIVDPIFAHRITEAATFVARSWPQGQQLDFITSLSQQAEAAHPQQEQDQEEQEEDKDSVETEQVSNAKRQVVKQLVLALASNDSNKDQGAATTGAALEGTDREFEAFSNLILSLVLASFAAPQSNDSDSGDSDDYSSLLLILVDAMAINSVRPVPIAPSAAARYSALCTLFNSLPLASSSNAGTASTAATLRLSVVLKLLHFAIANDDLPIVEPVLAALHGWLVEWGFGHGSHGEEEGNAAIGSVVRSLLARQQFAAARSLLQQHLQQPSAVPGESATVSASAAVLASDFIALSLRQPDFFDFASLAAIPAVSAPSVAALTPLLALFTSGTVASLDLFLASADGQKVMQLYAALLDEQALKSKLKLLALAELCSDRVGLSVSYQEMAVALGIQGQMEEVAEEVEISVIDAIRANLLSGRLSQPLSTLQVTSAAPRSFTPAHWTQLQTRLQTWKVSLGNLLDSVVKGAAAGPGPSATLASIEGHVVDSTSSLASAPAAAVVAV